MTGAGRYLVVTPCRDEGEFIASAIESLAAQTVRPATWVIVDDGSTDNTPDVLAEYAAKHDFIRIVRREDRGERKVGPGVIEAFYAGYESIDPGEYEFVCKMDADLELPARYFERLIEEMDREPCLGAVSGKMYLRDEHGRLHHERRGDDHAAGPTKFYRLACFEDIGGFVRMVGWDGIDGHVCRMKGWIARSIVDAELKVVHLRQMGSSHNGVLHGRVRGGQGKWRIGSSPWYLLATALYRMRDKPYVIGAIAMTYGYFRAMLTGVERMDEPAYLRHLRRYEWRTLLRGKARTLRAYDEQARMRRAARVSPGMPQGDAA
ncbi:MAG: glycosyltransferase family A protein [Planctomycetota bacterium]